MNWRTNQSDGAFPGGNAVVCTGLRKRFRDFTLGELDLAVPEGTICGLVGENGAGKTTAIRLLMGALRPDGGAVQVLGADPFTPTFREAKEDIGVVLDEAYFPEVLTALQVGKVLRGTYRRWDEDIYSSFLKRFDLPEKKPFKEYSRGMRMKLAIASALSHRPKLLILDEATAGLDPIARDEVVEVFRDFGSAEDHSILISSHILSDLEKLCDTIAFLHRGRLLFCQGKDALLEEYGIFTGTAEQAESLRPEAVAGREDRQYGGVRALVRRDLVPDALLPDLERPTVEDVILFTVKGAKEAGETAARSDEAGERFQREKGAGKGPRWGKEA